MRTIVTIVIFLGIWFTGILTAQDITLPSIYQEIHTGNFKNAVSLLNKFISQNHDSTNAYIILAKIYLGIGGISNRSKAERTLKEALRRDPKNAILLQLLADIKEEQVLPQSAILYLKRAVAANPTDSKILNQLLENYVQENDKAGLKILEDAIENWIKANPDSQSGYISLGKLYISLGDGKKAMPALEKGAKINPGYIPIYKLFSDAHLLAGNRSLFTENYFYWLSHEKDFLALQNEYQLAELAMTDEGITKFRNIPPDKKSDYLITYWHERDPNPITVENERLIEHYRRVHYVKTHFHTTLSPLGFDDRGKVYIKWGPPEEKYEDPVPTLVLESDAGIQTDSRNAGFDAPTSFAIRGNESWYYPSIGYYLAFDFVRFGGYYREVNSLLEAIPGSGAKSNIGLSPTGGDRPLYIEWYKMQQLYRDRSHLGGLYSSLANRPVGTFARDIYSEIPVEKISTKRNSKPRFEVSLDIPPLDFMIKSVQFRGTSGKTRLEIGYGVELNQLKPKPYRNTTFTFLFSNDFVIFDSSSHRILHRKYQFKKSFPPHYEYDKKSIVGEDSCELQPQIYDMAFQMIEISNKTGKFMKEKILVKDFNGNDLMISDLKVSPNAEVSGINKETEKEKLHVYPYPFSNISQKLPIHLYFEIYNLTLSPEQQTNYEISLKMEREVRKREFAVEAIRSFGRIFTGGKPREIETVYQRMGDDQTALEYIELDLSKLNPGHARLTVTVQDINIGKQVENSVEFDLQ